MREPRRRRARALALAGLQRSAAVLPAGLIELGLRGVALSARFGAPGKLARENLVRVFGSELSGRELERMRAKVFSHAARLCAEWVRLARSAPPDSEQAERGKWIEDRVLLDPSLAILEREHARGHGVIVATAHIGNWELLAARLCRAGFRGAVVGRMRANDSSTDWLERMREAYGARTLPQDSPPRRLLEVLHGGGILGMLCDLEVRRLDGEYLPFLGHPALTMTAPAALARASRAPLVPMRCIAVDGQRYLLQAEEPLALDPELERRAAAIDLLRRLNAIYERWIRETPSQWAWHQERWGTQPGEHDAVPLVEHKRRSRARRRKG
jgi:KDO2-lipid IV(A) lauroyltransferase